MINLYVHNAYINVTVLLAGSMRPLSMVSTNRSVGKAEDITRQYAM
jgi:hypothetical protein